VAGVGRATALRNRLLNAGYVPTPAFGKAPVLEGWQKKQPTEADISDWSTRYPTARNTGILTRDTPAVDIDVLDAAVADELQNILSSTSGITSGIGITRVGQSPKRALLFQTDVPFCKISTPVFVSPDQQEHRVEVLGEGQQIITHGIHPITGRPYVWFGGEPGDVRRDQLPYINSALASEFIVRATACMQAYGWTTKSRPNENRILHVATDGSFDRLYGSREQKYAQAALEGAVAELGGAPAGRRNDTLNVLAYRMGRMVGRGWLSRDEVVRRLLDAAQACGCVADDGEAAARKTLKSGLDAGEKEPFPDLDARDGVGTEAWRRRTTSSHSEAAPKAELDMVCLADMKAKPIDWLWPNWIAIGKVACLAGEGGKGKSTILCDIAARTSKGEIWPDGAGATAAGSAIILAAEDDIEDTLVPRLLAVGADMKRIHVIRAVRQENSTRRAFSLQADLSRLEAEIKRLGDVRLVIIDPISSYLGRVDSHKNAEVRSVLEPLGEMASRLRVAVVCNNHFSKSGGNANSRIIGSVAFVNQARAAFVVVDDAENPGRLLLTPSKMNMAPLKYGLAYRIEGVAVEAEGQDILTSRIAWETTPVTISADEALAAHDEKGEAKTAKAEAMEFLLSVLANGPVAAADVQKDARGAGISPKALRTAREVLGIKPEKAGFDEGWVWALPKVPSTPEGAHAGKWAPSDSEGIFAREFCDHCRRPGTEDNPLQAVAPGGHPARLHTSCIPYFHPPVQPDELGIPGFLKRARDDNCGSPS
jgi:AAA domain/Bifunctional DNA primase/polymerase, N-terminal